MKLLKFNFLIAALLMIGMLACESEEPGVEEINIADGNAVSESLQFKNTTAESKDGELPAPSTDDNAPILYTEGYEANITSISGNDFVLDVQEITGSDVKGMYLQINGADTYFDILLESASNGGRLAGSPGRSFFRNQSRVQEYMENILISLPENMASGEFCFTFAVYDIEGKVSNQINICVEILKSGGENSSFLTANPWEMVYEYSKESYDANGDEIVEVYEDYDSVGVLNLETYTTTMYCSDTSYSEVTVNNEYKINYAYVTFSNEGGMELENSVYDKYLDYEKSTCDNILYKIKEEPEKYNGTWSYNDDKKELTMVIEYIYEYEGVEMTEIGVQKYKVELKDGLIKLYFEINYSDQSEEKFYYEMVLQPKQ